MLPKYNSSQINDDKSDEQLPFHVPILLSNKSCEKNQYNRINKKAFYYIYNEYHKKYSKNKNDKGKIPKGNIINNKIPSKKNNNLSFNRKFSFVRRNKDDDKNDISKSISIQKYNTINNNFSIGIGQNIEDKINDISLNKNDKNDKQNKFKRCSSNYHLYIPNLNFLNKLIKKDNNSFQKKKEKKNKDKSFIFKRNSKNRIFSSKSDVSNDKNLKIYMSLKFEDNKLNNNIQNDMNKEMVYYKRMTKIDKFLKLINNDNLKVHHISFNKNKDINNIFKVSEVNNLKIIKKNIIKEYNNKRAISNISIKKDKNKPNGNLFNKYLISSQSQFTKKSEKINKEMINSNNSELKYVYNNNNSNINLYDREKNKNIHKMIQYVYNYEKFQDKKNRNMKKINDIENKKVDYTFSQEKINNNHETKIINENIKIKQIRINKDNKYQIKNNKNKVINKSPNIPYDLKYFQTMISGRTINDKFNQKNFNKNHSNEENYYNKNISSINNQSNESTKRIQNNSIKKSLNKFNLNEIKITNKDKEVRNNSFNNLFSTKINNNADITNVRKYLNNYYNNKYKSKLIKNNSFNYTSDKSQSFNENNYIDSIKNNLIENLINEDKNNKNNNNNNSYYYNNLSSNVNINININQNDTSNKKSDINSNNSDILIFNQKQNGENKSQNSLRLLTPSFINEENKENNDSKSKIPKINTKNIHENNKTNEIHNRKNILNIPFNPDNNKKFPIISGNDYTFKNRNYNYRNKLMKKNQFKLNLSSLEQNKNGFFDENHPNKQSYYNINSQKRKEDLFQLLNFSQNLKSKGK